MRTILHCFYSSFPAVLQAFNGESHVIHDNNVFRIVAVGHDVLIYNPLHQHHYCTIFVKQGEERARNLTSWENTNDCMQGRPELKFNNMEMSKWITGSIDDEYASIDVHSA